MFETLGAASTVMTKDKELWLLTHEATTSSSQGSPFGS